MLLSEPAWPPSNSKSSPSHSCKTTRNKIKLWIIGLQCYIRKQIVVTQNLKKQTNKKKKLKKKWQTKAPTKSNKQWKKWDTFPSKLGSYLRIITCLVSFVLGQESRQFFLYCCIAGLVTKPIPYWCFFYLTTCQILVPKLFPHFFLSGGFVGRPGSVMAGSVMAGGVMGSWGRRIRRRINIFRRKSNRQYSTAFATAFARMLSGKRRQKKWRKPIKLS